MTAAFNVLNWPGVSIDSPLVLVFAMSLAFGWLCQWRQGSRVDAWLAGSIGMFLVAFAFYRIAFVNYFAIPMALMLFLILADARPPAAGARGWLAHLRGEDRQQQDRDVLQGVQEPALARVHEHPNPVDPHARERQAHQDPGAECDPPAAGPDPDERERKSDRLDQDQRGGPLVEARRAQGRRSAHITGLPATMRATNGGQNRQKARNGQDTGAGWSRQIAHAVAPSGIAHQRMAGRTVNGTRRSRTLGG